MVSEKYQRITVADKAAVNCPACGNGRVRRSRHRGLIETLKLLLLSAKPYRCESCGERFYCSFEKGSD